MTDETEQFVRRGLQPSTSNPRLAEFETFLQYIVGESNAMFRVIDAARAGGEDIRGADANGEGEPGNPHHQPALRDWMQVLLPEPRIRGNDDDDEEEDSDEYDDEDDDEDYEFNDDDDDDDEGNDGNDDGNGFAWLYGMDGDWSEPYQGDESSDYEDNDDTTGRGSAGNRNNSAECVNTDSHGDDCKDDSAKTSS